MKIKELKQKCGECPLIDFCGESFGFCICENEEFQDTEVSAYKEIAEKAETIPYPLCKECDKGDCDECDITDIARDFYCEQIANAVAKALKGGVAWRNLDTDEIISDDEFNEACLECRCFCSEGNISRPCDGDKHNCPYFKKID